METNTNQFYRGEIYHGLRNFGASQMVRAAKLNFFGPVTLVCALGVIAHYLESLFTN